MTKGAHGRQRALPPGRRIRVLIVDDSAVIRCVVARALSDEPDIEVIGSAPNGSIGLDKAAQSNPDVMILDVEMPEMNGLEVLHALQQRAQRPCVIMFSSLTERGASTTIEALIAGADDYATKTPSSAVESAVPAIKARLLPKIRHMFTAAVPDTVPGSEPAPKGTHAATRNGQSRPELRAVAIGVSTGGPSALATLVPALPASLSIPVLIVQHMPQMFTRLLAERLARLTPLRVEEAQDATPLSGGGIFIAPGDEHLVVAGSLQEPQIRIEHSAPRNSCRPSVDVLFESVAAVYGAASLGVVLTGMGQDGLQGARMLRGAGASVLVQDEATSVVWGMPGSVAKAGLADAVLPLDAIAAAIDANWTRREVRT